MQMAATDIVGTWFPSGYYGHYRSKTRNDILQQYRHEASPTPPSQFIKWVRTSPDNHRFSKHDNKHSFPTDASYFDTGLGRRKGAASITAFNPEFMTWWPHKEALAREGSSVSLYRLDFRKGGIKSTEPLPQRVSPRIRKKMADMETNDAKLKWISDYKKHFSHGQPNTRINTDLNTGRPYEGPDTNPRSHQYVNMTGKLKRVVPPYLAHTIRRIKSAPPIRFSVGDCLVWNSTPTAGIPVRNSFSTHNTNHGEVHPHPPRTERNDSDTPRSPRQQTYQRPPATTVTDTKKNMTPTATAISTFSPIQERSPPATSLSVPLPRNPTVVID